MSNFNDVYRYTVLITKLIWRISSAIGFYLIYNGPVDPQIRAFLLRIPSTVSDTRVTFRVCGPLDCLILGIAK